MAIPIENANLLALILEALLYGVLLALFCSATYILVTGKREANRKLLYTLFSMFALSTLHLVLDAMRAFDAFLHGVDGSSHAYYLNLSHPLEAAKTAVYVVLTLIGDSFVIYRCYIVWARSWHITVVPILFLLGTAVSGCGVVVVITQTVPGAEVFLRRIVPWITSFFVITLITNFLCTSLIAFKIQRMRRLVRGIALSDRGASVLAIVVESAAIYSATVLSLMVAYLSQSNAQYTLLDMTSPIIGITFTVIILRVSLGLSSGDFHRVGMTTINESRQVTTIGGSRSREGFQMIRRPAFAVSVSHLVEMDKMPEESPTQEEGRKATVP